MNEEEKIKQWMLKFGYEDEQIKNILEKMDIKNIDNSNLFRRIKRLNYYFVIMGYKKEEIIKITHLVPLIYKFALEYIVKKIKVLLPFGVEFKDIIKMTNHNPNYYIYPLARIEEILNWILEYSNSPKDIVNFFAACTFMPPMIEKLNEKNEKLTRIGFNNKNIAKIIKYNPKLFVVSDRYNQKKVDDLKDLGYQLEQIIKMFKKMPQILTFSKEKIQDKIDSLVSVGLSKSQVITITALSPSILTYDIHTFQNKINLFKEYGYNAEQIILLLQHHPAILGSSEENIRNKLDFYLSIGLFAIVYLEPKQLIQGLDLTYARYKFFTEKGMNISLYNYRLLFNSTENFKKKYGFTSKDLIAIYPLAAENKYDGINFKPKTNIKKVL